MSTVLELRHYTPKPTTIITDRVYVQGRPAYKPFGLWVSVGDDWERWCREEGYALEHLAVVQTVMLRSDANVIVLDSVEALDKFTAEFGDGDPCYGYIDWAQVSCQAQGIIIAPYQWGRRLELMWYYGWDCASGCLWDLSCIEDES